MFSKRFEVPQVKYSTEYKRNFTFVAITSTGDLVDNAGVVHLISKLREAREERIRPPH